MQADLIVQVLLLTRVFQNYILADSFSNEVPFKIGCALLTLLLLTVWVCCVVVALLLSCSFFSPSSWPPTDDSDLLKILPQPDGKQVQKCSSKPESE